MPLTLGLSRVNPTTQPGDAAAKERALLPRPELLPKPIQNHASGGPLESEGCSLPSPPHSLHVRLLLHTLTPSQDSLRGMARERKRLQREETSWGHLRYMQGGELSKVVAGGGWSHMGLQVEAESSKGLHVPPQGHTASPSTAGRSRHLCSGQVSSSARGRGHSTGARATAQGDRLTGQAWLPGHLPSLGVGGSRPVPTIGWCRGKGFSSEGQGQEPVLFLGTGDTGDPKLSSKSMGHVLEPTSPPDLTPHIHTWGLKEDIRSFITPFFQPTDWVPGSTGWQGLAYSHQHNS